MKKSSDSLPKTPSEPFNGGLYRQMVRCGKPTCRCASGELHEGYFYLLRRVNGKLVKTYVRKADVARVRAIIEAARNRRNLDRRLRNANRTFLASVRTRLRSTRSSIHELKQNTHTDAQI